MRASHKIETAQKMVASHDSHRLVSQPALHSKATAKSKRANAAHSNPRRKMAPSEL
jgi:hypothetical protein